MLHQILKNACRATLAVWTLLCLFGIFDENTAMSMTRWIVQRLVFAAMLALGLWVARRYSVEDLYKASAKLHKLLSHKKQKHYGMD